MSSHFIPVHRENYFTFSNAMSISTYFSTAMYRFIKRPDREQFAQRCFDLTGCLCGLKHREGRTDSERAEYIHQGQCHCTQAQWGLCCVVCVVSCGVVWCRVVSCVVMFLMLEQVCQMCGGGQIVYKGKLCTFKQGMQ